MSINEAMTAVEQFPSHLGGSFHWHDGLQIGHSLIDEDHQRFFGHFNQAELCLGDPEAMEPLFQDILEDLLRHMEAEEAIMGEVGYPGGSSHRVLHRMLGEQAKAALIIGRDGGWAIAFRLLAISVLEHMAEDDVKLRPFLTRPHAV